MRSSLRFVRYLFGRVDGINRVMLISDVLAADDATQEIAKLQRPTSACSAAAAPNGVQMFVFLLSL